MQQSLSEIDWQLVFRRSSRWCRRSTGCSWKRGWIQRGIPRRIRRGRRSWRCRPGCKHLRWRSSMGRQSLPVYPKKFKFKFWKFKFRREIQIYVAGSFAAGGVDAEDIVRDNVAICCSAVSGGDAGSGHLHEDVGDALQNTVGGLTPSGNQEGVSNVSGLGGRCQADGLYLGCANELKWLV